MSGETPKTEAEKLEYKRNGFAFALDVIRRQCAQEASLIEMMKEKGLPTESLLDGHAKSKVLLAEIEAKAAALEAK